MAAAIRAILAACLAAGTVAAQGTQTRPESLCSAEEEIYLSARVPETGQLVSVCGSTDLAGADAWVQYRFGQRYLINRLIPQATGGGFAMFRYSNYTRPRTTYSSLVMTDGAFTLKLDEGFVADDPEPHTIFQTLLRDGEELETIRLEPLSEPLGMFNFDRIMKPPE